MDIILPHNTIPESIKWSIQTHKVSKAIIYAYHLQCANSQITVALEETEYCLLVGLYS